VPEDVQEKRYQRVLVVLGIVVLAFNLRPAAVSVGPVLDEISDSLRMGALQTALLTSLPVLSFATIGALAPRISRALGLHRTTLVALLLVTGGLLVRTHTGNGWVFLLLSFASLAGMAVANVLLPSLVKLHFPDKVGLLTAVYSTALAIGLTSASVLTVPLADSSTSAGSALDWRFGLVAWAFTALVAALPWVALVREDRRRTAAPSSFGTGAVARHPARAADRARCQLKRITAKALSLSHGSQAKR